MGDQMGKVTDIPTAYNSPVDVRVPQRKNRNKSSSSFRLGSTFTALKRSSSNPGARSIRQVLPRVATKRPSHDSELVVRKRPFQRHHSETITPHETPSRPYAGDDFQDSPGSDDLASNSVLEGPSSSPLTSYGPASVGIDTDPAQIVNLALSLSESRRQTLPGRAGSSLISQDRRLSHAIPARSLISDDMIPSMRNDDWQSKINTQGGSLRMSRNSQQLLASPIPFLAQGSQGLETHAFSAGTIARAEKAKRHFELVSEYLRLLPHLPPISPTPTKLNDLPGTPESSSAHGRVYNPLQYIRNRKVRFRERKPINAEEEGWGDVAGVRAWVDHIIQSLDNKEYAAEECFRLPPLKSPTGGNETSQELENLHSSPSRTNTSDANKPRRPRLDWAMTPADLLADAAWVEADSNKLKLENTDGHKIFPGTTKLRPVKLATPNPSLELTSISQFYNPLYSTGELPNFKSIGSRSAYNPNRGRRINKFVKSTHLMPSHGRSVSGSTSGWRRALSRSRSPSSSRSNGDDKSPSKGYLKNQTSLKLRNTVRDLLPPLDVDLNEHTTSRHLGYPPSLSSIDNSHNIYTSRPSFEEAESLQQSPINKPVFPSIASNLSPTWSRDSSPSRNYHLSIQDSIDRQSSKLQHDDVVSPQPPPKPQAATFAISGLEPQYPKFDNQNPRFSNDLYIPSHDSSIQHPSSSNSRIGKELDSKRRGIFKGGRLAELVGSEVSKVGELIRKKDQSSHSRYSSSSSSNSEFMDVGDTIPGSRRIPKPKLTRFPTQSDIGTQSQIEQVSEPPKYYTSNLPAFTSSLKRDGINTEYPLPSQSRIDSVKIDPSVDNNASLGVEKNLGQKQSLLWLGRGHPEPAAPIQRRPGLQSTRHWTQSSRSIPKYSGSYRIDKNEIVRVRAHLLSTGVKAKEICRLSNENSPFPTFNPLFIGASDYLHSPLPYIGDEKLAAAATKCLMCAFDDRMYKVQNTISEFSSSSIPKLISDFELLERLVTTSLSDRLSVVSHEAENLTSQLATTSTLAIKQLNDALDKGIRKRKRRFRWVSRFGYVLLEWVLVGVMWCVWTVVMIWKLCKGIWRGSVSGVRWIFWL
ncbi:hypothetical protein LOZ39_001846 [Ophidiomyces ophidiicola]|nr:hypothetical protein LOZ50_001238 [Ophidiomyces ophidiicola]KAI2015349.1 hypothetical protein LOZ49_000757 [Ophidiomyces ophidiicola]KAI2078081.1 hypothetical protein LOZ39_001846 [Ophidiomyces ophidiicola]KAI2138364.1 hypothetical protein LOZ29_002825 [Ophidiomyces ophidiicola]KAI2141073.1 hypothetical protein LOZ28_002632 [Ophidiomyces ophidiicola]